MPSTSAKQHRFMQAVAHSPSFAKKAGVSQSVGKDFSAADKGRKFGNGGRAGINKPNTRHGKMDMPVANLNKYAGLKGGGMAKKSKRFSGEDGKSEVTNPYSGPSDLKDLYKEKYVPEEKAVIAKSKPAEEIAEDTRAVTGMASRKYKNMPSDEKKAESAERIKDMTMAAASLTPIGGLGRVGNAYQQANRTNAEYRRFKEVAGRDYNLNRNQIARGEAATAGSNLYGRRGFTGERATRSVVDRVRDQGFAKGGTIMESKKMMGKEVAFMKKKGAPSSMIKHEKAEMGMKAGGMARGGMPPGAMAAMMAKRQQPMRRPPPGGMPPPAQPPMGMKAGGKVKRYDDGGNISKEDIAAFGLPAAQKIQENKAENKGYLAGQDKYPAEARLQKDLAAPARIARKTGVYLKEKYGDVKGNVKGMLGDREALRELRGGQLSREAALGYQKGGMPMKDGKPAFMQKKMNMGGMAYAKGGGIESRGKTKGTVIRMAAGGSVSSRADGIAQRGKTRA